MDREYSVVLVYSTSHAMRIEKALKAEGIPCRMVPVPRALSSDCGVCVRVDRPERERVRGILEALKIEVQGLCDV